MEYAIIYTPGPKWHHGHPPAEQLGEHDAHLKELRRRKKLLQGGSFDKENRSVVVLEVASESEAEHLLNQNPAVAKGVLEGELRSWHIVFGLQAGTSRPTPT